MSERGQKIYKIVVWVVLVIAIVAGVRKKYIQLTNPYITRYEWLEMLTDRLGVGGYESKKAYYKDVKGRNMYFDDVQACVEAGILTGKGKFDGDADADKEFMTVTLMKAIGEKRLPPLSEGEHYSDKELMQLADELDILPSEGLNGGITMNEAEELMDSGADYYHDPDYFPQYIEVEWKEDVIDTRDMEGLEYDTDDDSIRVAGEELVPETGQILILEGEHGFTVAKKVRSVNSLTPEGYIAWLEDPDRLGEIVDSLSFSGSSDFSLMTADAEAPEPDKMPENADEADETDEAAAGIAGGISAPGSFAGQRILAYPGMLIDPTDHINDLFPLPGRNPIPVWVPPVSGKADIEILFELSQEIAYGGSSSGVHAALSMSEPGGGVCFIGEYENGQMKAGLTGKEVRLEKNEEEVKSITDLLDTMEEEIESRTEKQKIKSSKTGDDGKAETKETDSIFLKLNIKNLSVKGEALYFDLYEMRNLSYANLYLTADSISLNGGVKVNGSGRVLKDKIAEVPVTLAGGVTVDLGFYLVIEANGEIGVTYEIDGLCVDVKASPKNTVCNAESTGSKLEFYVDVEIGLGAEVQATFKFLGASMVDPSAKVMGVLDIKPTLLTKDDLEEKYRSYGACLNLTFTAPVVTVSAWDTEGDSMIQWVMDTLDVEMDPQYECIEKDSDKAKSVGFHLDYDSSYGFQLTEGGDDECLHKKKPEPTTAAVQKEKNDESGNNKQDGQKENVAETGDPEAGRGMHDALVGAVGKHYGLGTEKAEEKLEELNESLERRLNKWLENLDGWMAQQLDKFCGDCKC